MLFIGNSFTTKNDLPALLSVIVKAGMGITIEYKVISAGGASLRRHWNGGAANTIASAKWDYVVFQEQSTLPVKNSNRFHENLREFVPAMKESGAKMVFFIKSRSRSIGSVQNRPGFYLQDWRETILHEFRRW